MNSYQFAYLSVTSSKIWANDSKRSLAVHTTKHTTNYLHKLLINVTFLFFIHEVAIY